MTNPIDERFDNSCQINLLQRRNRELAIQFWSGFEDYFGPQAYIPLDAVVMLFDDDKTSEAIFDAFKQKLYCDAHLKDGWAAVMKCAKDFNLRVPDLMMECLCNSCACRECKQNCSGRTCEQCKADYGCGYNSYCDD